MASQNTSQTSGAVASVQPRTTSFIDKFLEWSHGIPSPEPFRRWAAVVAIAGAMERRCWTETAESIMHPNLFVLLVAPPGVGKSQAIDRVHELWASTGKLNVAPSSITKAGMIDHLQEGQKQVTNGAFEIYHCLNIASSEFGSLVPAHDLAFLNTLNELYDCRNVYEERTRGGGKLQLDKPHICIIAGTQPKFLAELLPETAFGMGFTSRLIMVFCAEQVKVKIFGKRENRSSISRNDLVGDLRRVCELRGEFQWEDEAASALEEWHEEDMPPKPDHPKLQSYNPRRLAHLIKLCMVHSAAESNELVVRKRHFDQARELLLDAEAVMPEIFRDMQAGGHADVINEAWNFLRAQYMKGNKEGVREHMLHHFLQQRIPAYQIESTIESMLKSGMMEVTGKQTAPGMRRFIPTSKHNTS